MPPNDQASKLIGLPSFSEVDNFPLEEQRRGEIVLVGAGPGDPDLLTLAALKAIHRADYVVSDRLIPKPILELVKCELRIARKWKGRADEAQNEVNEWCLEALLEGKYVVRLKIGDPFLFGRGGEEVLFFRQHGYECKVIPGVSSSLSAPLVANIPPTHRGVADQVLIVTGQGRGGSIPELPSYSSHRTTVFLMAIGRLSEVTSGLIEQQGFPADCPAAIIENATLPKQRVIRGTLTTIASQCAEANVKPPACFVVGHVVSVLDNSSITSLLPHGSSATTRLDHQQTTSNLAETTPQAAAVPLPYIQPSKSMAIPVSQQNNEQSSPIIGLDDQEHQHGSQLQFDVTISTWTSYASVEPKQEYKPYTNRFDKDSFTAMKFKVGSPSEPPSWGAFVSELLEQRNSANNVVKVKACVL